MHDLAVRVFETVLENATYPDGIGVFPVESEVAIETALAAANVLLPSHKQISSSDLLNAKYAIKPWKIEYPPSGTVHQVVSALGLKSIDDVLCADAEEMRQLCRKAQQVKQMSKPRHTAVCQDCGFVGSIAVTKPLSDISMAAFLERVYPGEKMPCGICPECGAFCHFPD